MGVIWGICGLHRALLADYIERGTCWDHASLGL